MLNGLNFFEKHSQPHGRSFLGSGKNAMFLVRRDEDIIAGFQTPNRPFALKLQCRLTAKQNHPFGFRLVVPKVLRTRLPGGNDPFDTNVFRLEKGIDQFLRQGGRQIMEQILLDSPDRVFALENKGGKRSLRPRQSAKQAPSLITERYLLAIH